MRFSKTIAVSLAAGMLIGVVGCGSSSGSGDNSGNKNRSVSIKGKIVDPYIVGAVLCEDINKDNSCADTEQKSSVSDENGEFTFSSKLTVGSHIITQAQGKHNGLEYDLSLSGVVNEDGTIEVVSPITTLETKGLSKTQIITILDNAGISSLNEDDISSDPMQGLSGKTAVTNEELKYLQASLATYGLLKIMEGSEALSALTATQIASSNEVNLIATQMVTAIQSSLNQTTFNTIKNEMDGARSAIPSEFSSYVTIPDVTTDVVIKTATTVMDRIVQAGFDKCNETDGNVTLALQEANSIAMQVQGKVANIAQYYYGLENKTQLALVNSHAPNSLPPQVKKGTLNETGVFKLDESNSFVLTDQEKIKTKAISRYLELNGGDLGDASINIDSIQSHVKSVKVDEQTYTISDSTISIPLSTIGDGKHKFTIVLLDGSEKYFYFYKGSYDAISENATFNGNTSYHFSSIKADGADAKDIFVRIDNNNDTGTTSDDYKILMLPDDSGQINVTHLKSSSGHSIYSSNYERWIVASIHNDITAQDTNMTYEVDVSKIVENTKISGKFLKVDEQSTPLAVAFSSADIALSDIWLHPHYTHPSAKVSAVCSGPLCESNVSSEPIWVATQDMHLGHLTNASYDFSTAEYFIERLSGGHNYTIAAFWLNKNLSLSFPANYIQSGVDNGDNIITLHAMSKDVNGTLSDNNTTLRVARVVTFLGQPTLHYSDRVTKDTSNFFSVKYQYDSEDTKTYILWGGESDSLDLSQNANCEGISSCREIVIGGENDSSTNISLP